MFEALDIAQYVLIRCFNCRGRVRCSQRLPSMASLADNSKVIFPAEESYTASLI